jgi:hypothetical protein
MQLSCAPKPPLSRLEAVLEVKRRADTDANADGMALVQEKRLRRAVSLHDGCTESAPAASNDDIGPRYRLPFIVLPRSSVSERSLPAVPH